MAQAFPSLKTEYLHAYLQTGSRDSSAGIATRLALDTGIGVQFQAEVRDFFFSITFTPAPGLIQSAIQWAPGAVSPEVKRQGREAEHSPPSSVEVKNGGAIPRLPHISSWSHA
jgi:hypothetical protein